MQHIIISGNLAADCEIVKTKEENELLKFTVAVSDGRPGEKPTYYSCRMRRSGVADYLKKGRGVTVLGTLKVSTNEKDDKTFVNLDVWVVHLDLGSAPKD